MSSFKIFFFLHFITALCECKTASIERKMEKWIAGSFYCSYDKFTNLEAGAIDKTIRNQFCSSHNGICSGDCSQNCKCIDNSHTFLSYDVGCVKTIDYFKGRLRIKRVKVFEDKV